MSYTQPLIVHGRLNSRATAQSVAKKLFKAVQPSASLRPWLAFLQHLPAKEHPLKLSPDAQWVIGYAKRRFFFCQLGTK